MIWIWLAGILFAAIAGFAILRAFSSPDFYIRFAIAAATQIVKYLLLHGRSFTPKEAARNRQGQFPYKWNDRDHTHEDHK